MTTIGIPALRRYEDERDQVIRAASEMLVDQVPPSKKVTENSLEVHRAVDRAAQLTDQPLTVGRRKQMDSELLNLNEAVLATIRLIDRVIGDDIRVEIGLSPRVGTVRIDRSQLEQVILNLAVNARDAMPDGGTIEIETACLLTEHLGTSFDVNNPIDAPVLEKPFTRASLTTKIEETLASR